MEGEAGPPPGAISQEITSPARDKESVQGAKVALSPPISTVPGRETAETEDLQSEEVAASGTTTKDKSDGEEVEGKDQGLMPKGEGRVAQFFEAQKKLAIREKLDNGEFDDNPELKKKAELALTYDPGKGVEENSGALKANIDILKISGDEGSQIALREISSNISVHLGDESYTLSEWDKKLESTSLDEKVRLEQEGIYGFEFPEEDAGQTESLRKTLPEVFDEQEKNLIEKIKDAKDKKEDTSKDEALLVGIKLIKEARGETGTYFKQKLLTELQAAGVENLEGLINEINEEAATGKQKLIEFLTERGIKENDMAGITEGNLDSLVRSGIYKKLEGLDELVFGRKMTEDEVKGILNGIMDKDKAANFMIAHRKDIGLGIAGLILLIIMAGMQAVEGLGSQQR